MFYWLYAFALLPCLRHYVFIYEVPSRCGAFLSSAHLWATEQKQVLHHCSKPAPVHLVLYGIGEVEKGSLVFISTVWQYGDKSLLLVV